MDRMTARGMWLAAALAVTAGVAACGSDGGGGGGAWRPGQPLTIDVDGTFPSGTAVRDAYGGTTATVNASGEVTVTPGPEGLVLLDAALARQGSA